MKVVFIWRWSLLGCGSYTDVVFIQRGSLYGGSSIEKLSLYRGGLYIIMEVVFKWRWSLSQ